MKQTSRRSLALLLALCLLFLPSCRFFSARTTAEGTLVITFLDVGQGDAILMQTKEGAVLVDAGTEKSEENLLLQLRRLGVKQIALFVMTHPDADHIGGADGVIDTFPVTEVWCCGTPSESGAARRVEASLDKAGLDAEAVTEGQRFSLGDLSLSVLSPKEPTTDTNASSIVLLVVFGSTQMLLMGDADKKVEGRLVESYPSYVLDCDLLKAGHHGSKTASSEGFLAVVTPIYTVISCGEGNSYGHPHGEVLERLAACGSEILRTDRSGNITFQTDGKVLSPLGTRGSNLSRLR